MKEFLALTGNEIDISGVPDKIKLLPIGKVKTEKGNFEVDDESVELIKEHFKNRRIDIVIDYEHQTLHDVQAPAGGWIKSIEKGDDAIIAKVEWTKKAAEYLKNKEYRYLSPVVIVRKRDKKATAIHSAALTNTPAIDGMFAIVNSVDIEDLFEGGDNKMDVKELAKILGLSEDATEEQVRAALASAGKAMEQVRELEDKKDDDMQCKDSDGSDVVANSTILSMLGLNADAKTEDVAASIMALKTGNNTQQEILDLKAKIQKRDAEEAVEKALKAGKITAAQKEWATAYALKDSEGFNSFVDKAPVTVPQGKMDLADAPEGTADADGVDITILKACGISQEDVKKYYKEG